MQEERKALSTLDCLISFRQSNTNAIQKVTITIPIIVRKINFLPSEEVSFSSDQPTVFTVAVTNQLRMKMMTIFNGLTTVNLWPCPRPKT
jgi:hypothetical protein